MPRPKKWDELKMTDKLVLVEGWARDGLTDEQICHNLDISHTLLYEWKKEYPEFTEALKKGKEVSDFMVENALFKRALGYQYDEITKENGVETRKVTKEVAGDTTAQIFWLKNRKTDKWRDKPDSEEKLKKLISMLSKLNLTEDEVNDLLKSL